MLVTIADHGTLRPEAVRASTSGANASLRWTTTLGTPNAKCIASAIMRRGSESGIHRPRTRALRGGVYSTSPARGIAPRPVLAEPPAWVWPQRYFNLLWHRTSCENRPELRCTNGQMHITQSHVVYLRALG